MEYYQTNDRFYGMSLKGARRVYAIRIELLTYYENPIKDMTLLAIKDVVGVINNNYQQLTRRTCSLNLLNYDENIADFVNYGDKFKLYVGLLVGSDIYWFSQGVFAVQNVSRSTDYFTIEGVDKGGILDGTVGLNVVDSKYIIPSGQNIRSAIRDTLALNLEQHNYRPVVSSTLSRPVDPQDVIVDMDYSNAVLQSEIAIDSNAPIGDLIVSLADGYSADVYYDTNGRLNFVHNVAAMTTDSYEKLPVKWVFNDAQVYDVQYTRSSNVKNAVTVYTNSSEFENVSATVYNTNPQSPNRIDLIGLRRMDSVEIPYVGASPEEQKRYCTAHGEYLIGQEEFNQNSITMTSIMIPHLDVGDRFIYKDNSFVIRSIDMNLDGTDMTISAIQI